MRIATDKVTDTELANINRSLRRHQIVRWGKYGGLSAEKLGPSGWLVAPHHVQAEGWTSVLDESQWDAQSAYLAQRWANVVHVAARDGVLGTLRHFALVEPTRIGLRALAELGEVYHPLVPIDEGHYQQAMDRARHQCFSAHQWCKMLRVDVDSMVCQWLEVNCDVAMQIAEQHGGRFADSATGPSWQYPLVTRDELAAAIRLARRGREGDK